MMSAFASCRLRLVRTLCFAALLAAALESINAIAAEAGIEFVASIGDIAGDGTVDQYEAATAVLSQLTVPHYAIMGNEEPDTSPAASYMVERHGIAFVFATPDRNGRDFTDGANTAGKTNGADWSADLHLVPSRFMAEGGSDDETQQHDSAPAAQCRSNRIRHRPRRSRTTHRTRYGGRQDPGTTAAAYRGALPEHGTSNVERDAADLWIETTRRENELSTERSNRVR